MAPKDVAEGGKELAGFAAAEQVESGMRLGLGTGSTVAFFLQGLARRIRDGELREVVGVPTSLGTEKAARTLGIPLATLEEAGILDLVVDGADEVDPRLDLIKGMGGALLREKMVAQAARRMVVIVDSAKVVERLGTRSPLPVEVVPFGWGCHLPFFGGLGARAELRRKQGGAAVITDNGNYLLDLRFPEGIPDPYRLEQALAARAGVVETGLFLGLAQEALVGGSPGVLTLKRAD